MTWREVTVYAYDCDGCSTPLPNEYDDPAWFGGKVDLAHYDTPHDQGWLYLDGRWLCGDCWHYCDKGNDGEPAAGSRSECCARREAS